MVRDSTSWVSLTMSYQIVLAIVRRIPWARTKGRWWQEKELRGERRVGLGGGKGLTSTGWLSWGGHGGRWWTVIGGQHKYSIRMDVYITKWAGRRMRICRLAGFWEGLGKEDWARNNGRAQSSRILRTDWAWGRMWFCWLEGWWRFVFGLGEGGFCSWW